VRPPGDNPYAPPAARVAETDEAAKPSRPSIGVRFLWTTLIGFPTYMSTVLFLPRKEWAVGALGSLFFALMSGLVAMCIPVRNKALFIIPSLLAGIVVAFLIGNDT